MQKNSKLAFYILTSIVSTHAHSAGFEIAEQSVTGLGQAFAGSAAVAGDASTIFFNPAGLTYLSHSQIAQGLHFIIPNSNFDNDGSALPTALGGSPLTGDGGDAGVLGVVPNFYLAHRLNQDVVVGLGINAPFGLVTEYDDDWVGRYHAIKSDLMVININPTFAFKASEKLSVGIGANVQYIDLELTQAVDFGAVCAQAAAGGNLAAAACAQPQNFDGKAKLTADDWSWGFNLGLIYQATEATRLGLAYRSKVSHHLTGKGKFDLPSNPIASAVALGAGFTSGAVSGNVDLPESLSLAIHHQLNDKWAVMADASWTRWERFQELKIESPVTRLNSTKEEKWENSMRYGIGFNYAHNDKWTFRGGIAFDETPVSDRYRTPRIADEDRKWVSVGASYQYSENMIIDAAYTHIFFDDPSLNDSTSSGYLLKGDYEVGVDIIAIQIRWNFI